MRNTQVPVMANSTTNRKTGTTTRNAILLRPLELRVLVLVRHRRRRRVDARERVGDVAAPLNAGRRISSRNRAMNGNAGRMPRWTFWYHRSSCHLNSCPASYASPMSARWPMPRIRPPSKRHRDAREPPERGGRDRGDEQEREVAGVDREQSARTARRRGRRGSSRASRRTCSRARCRPRRARPCGSSRRSPASGGPTPCSGRCTKRNATMMSVTTEIATKSARMT